MTPSLTLEVHQLGEVCIRAGSKPGEQTRRVKDGVSKGITLLVLDHHIHFPNSGKCSRRDRKDRFDEFDIVPINRHIALLIEVRTIPNPQTILVRSRPKKVLRGVLILVDTNEVLCDRVDGDSLWICEHGLLPFWFLAVVTRHYRLVTANEPRMPICPAVKNGKWATGATKLGLLVLLLSLTRIAELSPG